ncbi:MAG: transposase [Chloroflexi bacterium]|nr:transposase [Chloroflexota bacterium]
MSTNPIPLAFGNFYHIFNRGNNRENVFIQERNYAYFMELWWKHTFQVAETYAYCLLRNHFHAVVYVKDKEDLTGLKLKEPSQYFANCFNAYTRGVNNATGRIGALFERPFERIPVTDEPYLMRLVVYVHQNPQKHKFVEDFRDWDYSSYHELIGNVPTRLQRDKMMELFGSREDFIRIHQEIQPLENLDDEE